MNILMMTNTYLPHVGGVARSVDRTAQAFRRRGHRVLVVAPSFEGQPEHEPDVFRYPAIENFNGSEFSVSLPIPMLLTAALEDFKPDVVHSHHPFLIGDTALRVASRHNIPLVFTHHTLYERYTHYVPGDSSALKAFVVRLATEYANLCRHVIAPSRSVADLLQQRGVTTPISDVPTGVEVDQFSAGCGRAVRERLGIPPDAFVVGFVSRLAPEKNLAYLGESAAMFLAKRREAYFVVVGSGPAEAELTDPIRRRGLDGRLHLLGTLDGQALVDAYHAFDVFAFASQTETQGMVVVEAMAPGVPVVALDATGVREVVNDGDNGLLLPHDAPPARFADGLTQIARRPAQRRAMADAARRTASQLSCDACADRLLTIYQDLIRAGPDMSYLDDTPWSQIIRRLELEWNLWTTRAEAAVDAIRTPSSS